MGPEDRKSGFPHARGSRHPLLLTHDVFFGELQSSRSANGITLSHRIAASPPDEVEIHTHVDAHFVPVVVKRTGHAEYIVLGGTCSIAALDAEPMAPWHAADLLRVFPVLCQRCAGLLGLPIRWDVA